MKCLYKPHQVFPEEITMLHLPQLLILSMSDELTCSRTTKQMLRDANSALFLWNKNNHIEILIVLSNIFWWQQIKLAKLYFEF